MSEIRRIATSAVNMPMPEIEGLLQSVEHEFRMAALIIWTYQFERGHEATQRGIYQFYLANTRWINNWDLVDASAAEIVGNWTITRDRQVLDWLAESQSMWERRIAMVATHAFIKRGESGDALRIATALIHDPHDLIQKAVGWMLREVGKRCSREELQVYLAEHYQAMSRTTLRYAIEHFDPQDRKAYLSGMV
jgi:3-methyladenine DNA glycosylase AlkD